MYQPSRSDLKLSTFVSFAFSLATLSTCKRRQVSCIIIPEDYSQVYSIGYNGQPSGLPHSNCTAEPSNCGCIHAEMNAISKIRTTHKDLVLITTLSPCIICAGLILNSKQISTVIYCEEYKNSDPINILRNNINIWHYKAHPQKTRGHQ